MAGSKSNYLENKVINDNLRTTPVYLGLCTADPSEAATGGSCNETANAAGYVRTVITFAAPTLGVTQNSAKVTFPAATGNYGAPITHWVILDSATYGAGNVLYHGNFNVPKTYLVDDIPEVPVGGIEVTED